MKKILIVIFLISNIGFSQTNLKKAKSNLSSRSYNSSSVSSSTSSYDDNSSTNFFGELFINLLAFVTYKAALGNLEQRHFTPYPYYYSNVNGEYDFGMEKEDNKSIVSIGGNYLFGNAVNAIEANINWRFIPFLGVDLTHNRFFEKGLGGSDQLDVTSFMVNYYRIRERHVTGWWGIGVTNVGNEVNSLGFSYNLGIEVYPFNPMSIHLSYKQSFINQSHINIMKFQAKYHIKKKSLFAGYHDISLGGVKVSGPVIGAEFRF
jgi:hypothetical protein